MKTSCYAIAAALAVTVTTRAFAQTTPPGAPAATARVVAGSDYDDGSLKRSLFGEGWRAVWAKPVQVPVFDLSRFAGGLTPTERGGGKQTITLRFRETNGWREHYFRSVDKDPVTQAMPPAIQGTTVGNLVQDQTSMLFPAAGLLVPPFLEAIRVLHVTPSLYVMPDDPRLGEFRETFAGMLGTVELSPDEGPDGTPGFGGSTHIENGEDFLATVASERGNRLDEREFYAVRLVDFLVNDNDRSPDNIRFARYGRDSAYTWRPIPRDRDRAFFDARGLVVKFLIRPFYAKLISWGPGYSFEGLTFESYELDRRLLQRIDRAAADEIALRVQRSITDATIETAILRLPAEWRIEVAERLRTGLRARRDGIPPMSSQFYGWLASEVDVHGTDEDELAQITRHDDGRVTVTLRGRNEPRTVPPFSTRTFLPGETNEVRVYLRGGDDSAVVTGARNSAIAVRVLGDKGEDILADSAGGKGTTLYDADVDTEFATSSGTRISMADWSEPQQGEGVKYDSPWRPDWGSRRSWGPTFDFVHGAGLVVGFGPRYQSQAFRRLPHKWRIESNVLFGLGNRQPGVNLNVDYRAENSPLAIILNSRATKFEEFRFHGYGNDVEQVDRRLSQVRQDLVSVEPSLVWQIGWRTREKIDRPLSTSAPFFPGLRPLVGRAEAGPVFYWSDPSPSAGSPLTDEPIGGADAFGRAGLRVGLSLDRTSSGTISDRGWTFMGELIGFPAVWDANRSFSTASAALATYLPLPGSGNHLALRAGGEIASGEFPVQHSASIGGRSTLRGYGYQRYRGESAATGSAEIRIPTGTVPLLVKWTSGIFGLADVGRVWFDAESPGGWHSGFGGGFWLSSLGQTFSVSFAHGEENRFYLQRGLSF